ncbi:restriction endonuclease subunit S [Bradyrhizobium sp. SZCCHNS3004]|uniref:restriction endonuclease subunit S n=1 Tax=Bradyrhizobium sp. SZCCHNS3004 TaxID=3057312 RepID=UPI0029165161|nr:restriction endonuclease subunit S [Bradyrhizobium sp. SZCCHNS3004]
MSLPNGWTQAPLGNLLNAIEAGKNLRCEERPPRAGELGVVKVSAVTWGHFDPSQSKTLPTDYSPPKDAQIRHGDLLISRANTLELVGAVVLVENEPDGLFLSDKILRLVVDNELKRWLLSFLRSPYGRAQIEALATGNQLSMRNISQEALRNIETPIPPAPEQRRIVAKLDALFARLARARVELDRIPSLSSRLRSQAVRSAFEGKLSAEWRAKHQAEGTIDKKTSVLPTGWHSVTLGELSDIKSGITLGKKRPVNAVLTDVPYLRVANVQRGRLNLSVIKEIAVTQAEAESLYLQSGDILLNEGGDRDKLGRGWVWSGEISNCIHQNHVFRARLYDKRHSPKYISFYANEFGQDYFFEHGTQTTNLASISKSKLSSLPVPLAPPEEQAEIVRLLEDAFARADRLEAEAARARALLDRLEAAILTKAFKGELVPQDPNDEPASVLLERIRAQRAAAEPVPSAKRGRRAQ